MRRRNRGGKRCFFFSGIASAFGRRALPELATGRIIDRPSPFQHRLRLEPLEDRRMLTVFLVDSLADTLADDGVTTLREAIQAANTNTELWGGAVPAGSATETDVIRFAESLFTDGENPVPGTITLGGAELEITDTAGVDLQGPGADRLAIDANRQSRVWNVSASAVVVLSGLTITGGHASGDGGGIYSLGTLTITNSTLSGNSAVYGGGIFNYSGTLSITNSTLSGNWADGPGGGIYNLSNTLSITNSTLSGNWADGSGGGIYNSSGTLSITNSALSGNSAYYYGGGIYVSSGTLSITNSTLSGNSAYYYGGGIYTYASSSVTTLKNTIVAQNVASTRPDICCSSGTLSGSHNLIGDGSGQSALVHGVNGNQVGTSASPIDPRLSDLSQLDSGQWGYYLLPGSPALDAGNNALALDPAGQPLTEDLFGNPRIQNSTVDLGAVEGATAGTPARIYVVASLENTIAEDGVLTFIEAFEAANRNQPVGDAPAGSFSQQDVIQFAEGLSGTVLVDQGELVIVADLSIEGPGAGRLVFDALGQNRVFRIQAGVAASLGGMTITGGSADGGGGIYNDYGTLSITNSTLSGNSAGYGGGIYTSGSLSVTTLNNTIVAQNAASTAGPDIRHYSGTLSGSHNLIGDDSGQSALVDGVNGNQVGTPALPIDPRLSETYRLLPGSPAINAGSNALAVDPDGNSLETDLDGNPRVIGGVVDLGAYECQSVFYVVDSLADTVADDGLLTLREALMAANTNTDLWDGAVPAGSTTETDVIRFAESLFTDGETPVPGTITLGGTQLLVSGKLDIEGPGADLLSINANQLSRVFLIDSGVEANLSGLTITGGTATTGGGISSAGTLTVIDAIISGNSATTTSGRGGGVYSTGTLIVTGSSISNNSAGQYGGGICSYGSSATASISNSTISGNTAANYGGGVFSSGVLTVTGSALSQNSATASSGSGGGAIANSGTAFVINSTISANSSGQYGGGIYSSGSSSKLTLTNSMVTANSAVGQGGGIYLNTFSTAPVLYNSVIAANTGSGNTQVQGNVSSDSSHNFIGLSAGLSGITNGVNGNQIGVGSPIDPMLGPLQDNGGPTWTHAPLPGSPLIDAGNDSKALDAKGNALLADGRGFLRLYGTVDIGAVELQPPGIPVAYDDAFVADQGDAIALDVLANDSCNDGSPMAAVIVEPPARGMLEENPDGTWTYTPDVDFWGMDMCSYRAVNGELHSNTAQVFVSVLSPTSIIVTTADDELDGDLSPDDISLREALAMATSGSTIQFSAAMLNQVTKLTYSTTATLAIADVQIIGPGASFLTIDGNARGTVFQATGGESLLSHITVTGGTSSGIVVNAGVELSLDHMVVNGNRSGSGSSGGGILNDGVLTVANSDISWNATSRHGGGIHSNNGSLTLTNSTVSNNVAMSDRSVGGGICNFSGAINIVNSTISDNTITGTGALPVVAGGGLYSYSGPVNVTNSIVSHNRVTGGYPNSGEGGGIFNTGGSICVTSSTISGNSANRQAGGIFSGGIGSTTSITNTIISGNSADEGGGIMNSGSEMAVTNSVVAGNSARRGGGIADWGAPSNPGVLRIINSTITGNSAEYQGGGLACYPEGVVMVNSIVAVNTASSYPNVSGSLAAESSHNLIGTDPGFIRNPSPGGDGVWGTADDDFGELRLRIDSPAVNAGSNALAVDAWGNRLTVDLDGNPRISGPSVDIGAYEYQFPRLPGDVDWSGTVDAEDAKILASNWGKSGMTWADGDFNGDGRVDAIDAAILAAHFGMTIAPPGETTPSTPEPPSVSLPSVGPGVADATPLVGPLPNSAANSARQPIRPVERLVGMGAQLVTQPGAQLVAQQREQLLTQQRAYALRSPEEVVDAVLGDEFGPMSEETMLFGRRAAWARTITRRTEPSRCDADDETVLAVDLLLARRR
ncbi:MAG TPA: hypothetical protein DD670_10540 [Planctomycetaceae bacterium]|nr:hypothetical protein [Planctomycetaceae bacterium]